MEQVAIIGEAVAGESVKVRRELEKLVKAFNKSEFDLAELLYKVQKNGYYKPEFDTFAAYVVDIGLSKRKGEYLAHIVDVMEQVGIGRNTYEPLGKSMLREITSLDPNVDYINPTTKEVTPMRDFIVGLVEKGQELGYKEVQQHVRTLKGLVGENDILNKTFGWTKSTWELTINPAIELAKRNIGSVARDKEGNSVDASDSKCVETWAIEYINDPSNNILEEETK